MFNNLAGKKWPFIVGGMVLLAIIGSFSSGNKSDSGTSTQSEVEETSAPAETAEPLGGFCLVTMKYMNEVVAMLGNAVDYPVGEITAKLRENGDLLTQGYDSSMIPNPDELVLVTGAGHQMLQIRARLIDGGDVMPPSQDLLASYNRVKDICG